MSRWPRWICYARAMLLHAPEPSARPSMTFEEWAAMDEDEPGELVDGQLVEEEVATFAHEVVAGWCIQTLRNWIVPRGGFVGTSEGKLKVTPRRGCKPDLFAYFPGSPRPRARDRLVTVPPDIAVEVVSPTPRDAKRDRVEKASEYAEFRVRYCWLVDPWARTLEILELGPDGRFVRALAAADGVVETVPGCEGLILDLDALWAEVDRIEPEEEAPSTDE